MAAFHSGVYLSRTTRNPPGPSLTFSSSQSYSPVTPRASHVHHLRGEDSGQSYAYAASDSGLLSIARTSGIIPDEKHSARLEAALEAFCRVIGASRERRTIQGLAEKQSLGSVELSAPSSTASVNLILVPVGTYGLDVHFPDSDVDCIIVGNISPASFWAIVQQNLSRQIDTAGNAHDLDCVILSRLIRNAAVQMLTLRVDEFRFRIQYSPSTVLAENWSKLKGSIEHDNTLPGLSLNLLSAYRDQTRFRNSIIFGSFQLSYRLVKLFCIRRGIYAPSLGFLGDVHLTVMLRRVAERLPDLTSASQLIKEFFQQYSVFEWASDAISITDTDTTYTRSAQEQIVILSSENHPAINVATNASFSTRQTVIKELCLARDALATGTPLARVWRSEAASLAVFLENYPCFIKIDLIYWGGNRTRARAFIAYTESRIARLLMDLHLADQETSIRLWPARLCNPSQKVIGGATSFMQGFYLLGLQSQRNVANTRQLIGVLESFERSVRGNSPYFNSSTCFFAATICARENITDYGSTEVDEPVWRDGGIDEPFNTEEDSEAGIASHSREAEVNPDLQEYFVNQAASKKQRKGAKVSKSKSHIPSERLRTSMDVYNRLMWDPLYDEADYLIGYEDRFLGTKELPLKSWSRKIDDENFIPFHRIVHFRQRSTGEAVWDRRMKLDRIFGSGVLATDL